jgi:hypothetical protein
VPEAPRRGRGLLGGDARPVVGDREHGLVAAPGERDAHLAVDRPVHTRVLDEVAQRPLERPGLPAHGEWRGLGDDDTRLVAAGCRGLERRQQRALLERPLGRRDEGRDDRLEIDLLGRELGARFAFEREQVVDQAGQAVGVGLAVGEQLGVGAVAAGEGRVPAQRRHRRAQLVRRVGEQPALGLARPVQRVEHAVERARQLTELIARGGRGQAPAHVGRLADRSRSHRHAP